jgi:4-hydroxy-tetrahydrodipicolinate synthase
MNDTATTPVSAANSGATLADRDPIRGVMVPILTPLTPQHEVDTASLRRLVNYLIDNGVHGIWAAGTTGEFAALDEPARRLVIETVADEVAGRVPVIGNVSAASTAAAACAARDVRGMPLVGIAATPPFFYTHTQEELLDHFRAIADAGEQPLWVYNIPPMVKLIVDAATTVQLADEGTVAGIKDSSSAGEAFAELVMRCRMRGIDPYRFVGTTWRNTMPGIGAHGVVPSIANLTPASVAGEWEEGERGDSEATLRHHATTMRAARIADLGSGQAGHFGALKTALKLLGVIDHDTLSAPMRALTDEQKAQIPELLKKLGL